MRTRQIADVPIGAIGLGCMPMSWAYGLAECDDAESVEVLREALDLGVTHWDTAAMYGVGDNERLIGLALKGNRDRVHVATKCGLRVTDRESYTLVKDGRPESVLAELDGSLERLGTDHVDLWYLHRTDDAVPLEETWGAMASAVQAGKARAIGLSEVTSEQATLAHAIHPVAAIQSELSIWTRDNLGAPLATEIPSDAPDFVYSGGGATPDNVVGWCADNGAAFVAFSPLGRGFLTGTVESVGSDDFRARNPRFTPGAIAANEAIVEIVRSVATRHDVTAAQIAIAWVLSQGEHVVAIPGTKRRTWLRQNAAASDVVLSQQDLADLDALPAIAGMRY